MPESKSRKKPATAAPAAKASSAPKPNPVWYKPVMFGLMIIGLLWIIVFYISESRFPIPELGAGNILVGFGIAIVGFLMTTRWR
ncbi:cell division protein CrgA [Arthrobacter sp. zg-Y820]|uniref:cell division protein CrgA n=1 Tax=unclassified Arthrobacter TaxID=235627 RepID=UPI0025416BC9|nr:MULTISPECIES: cell division protein CrgA [unclassified Arthrobacter]MCC9197383.1 cell division protein CrgA [Arthrobacter sp. zg-Y820]MDK1280249.1 cell division protein CrgA [Arthrobacter sp. zg.Y820]MDK1360614.1 cell division protein CrgA [Arthrobacter sp. zg-Y1219]WIB09538.1 cell division protein CrgA [Arthrobacter sp. zg-Y820]